MVACGKDRKMQVTISEVYAWYHENRPLFGISFSKESRTAIFH